MTLHRKIVTARGSLGLAQSTRPTLIMRKTNTAIACLECRSRKIIVIDTRFMAEEGYIRRRRKCEDCESRWSTYEVPLETMHRAVPEPYRSIMKVIDGWPGHRIRALVAFIKTFERNNGEEETTAPVQGRPDV